MSKRFTRFLAVVAMTIVFFTIATTVTAGSTTLTDKQRDPLETLATTVAGKSAVVKGAGNTLQSIAEDIADATVFSYDASSKTAVSKVNIVVEFGAILTIQGETLKMLGPKILVRFGGEVFIDNATVSGASGHRYDFAIFGGATIRNSRISGLSFEPMPFNSAVVNYRNVKLFPKRASEGRYFIGKVNIDQPADDTPVNVQTVAFIKTHIPLVKLYLEPKFDLLQFDLDDLSGRIDTAVFDALYEAVAGIRADISLTTRDLQATLTTRAKQEVAQPLESDDPELSMLRQRQTYLREINRVQNRLEARIDAVSRQMQEQLARLAPVEVPDVPMDDWLRDTFHRSIGSGISMAEPTFADPVPDGLTSMEILMRHLAKAGMTPYVDDICLRMINRGPEVGKTYMKALYREASKQNIKVFTPGDFKELMRDPTWGCLGQEGKRERHAPCWNNPKLINAMKEQIKTAVDLVGHEPSFAGFYLNEPRAFNGWDDICQTAFRAYLRDKYTAAELKALGIDDVDAVVPPLVTERGAQPILWAEHGDFRDESMKNAFQQLMDYMRSLHPDAKLFPIINPDVCPAKYGPIVDVLGCDFYSRGETRQAYATDLWWSTAKGPLIATIGAYKDTSPRMYERDLCTAYAHGDGLLLFEWSSIWKHAQRDDRRKHIRGWTPENWDITRKHFHRMERMEKYLTQTESAAVIGLLHSDRTHILDPPNTRSFKGPSLYAENMSGTYVALTYAHLQCEPFFDEGMTAARLARYKVLILPDARSLRNAEVNMIRDWVKGGGVLVATAGSTRFDEWGRELADYQLKDVFGTSYVEFRSEPKTLEMDIETGTELAAALGQKKLTCAAEGGYEVVRAESGRVVAAWGDGSPAIVVNNFGKGRSIFLTVRYPGRGYRTQAYIRTAKDFRPYTITLFEGLMKAALKTAGIEHPFTVANCPIDTTVVMRSQPGRYILHLLNHDLDQQSVSGVEATVNVPTTANVKVFYPDDSTPV